MRKLELDEYCQILNVTKEHLLKKKGTWGRCGLFGRICDKKHVIFMDMYRRGYYYKEIADIFGLKSHVTVLKGIRKIESHTIYEEIKIMIELCELRD